MYIYLNVCKQIIDVKLLLLYTNTLNNLTVCKQMIDVKLLLLYTNNLNNLTANKWLMPNSYCYILIL